MSEPAEYIVDDGEIELNAGRDTTRVAVRNTGDRPVQVGSHYHFFEVNRALDFDRRATYAMRLDIPAGTAVRFEPGDEREVGLVAIGGARRAIGFAALVDGDLGDVEAALGRARERKFLGTGEAGSEADQGSSGDGAGPAGGREQPGSPGGRVDTGETGAADTGGGSGGAG